MCLSKNNIHISNFINSIGLGLELGIGLANPSFRDSGILADDVDILADDVDILADDIDVLADDVDVLADDVDVLTDDVDVLADDIGRRWSISSSENLLVSRDPSIVYRKTVL